MDNQRLGGIEKRRLGKTDLLVTPIGQGCWQFAGRGMSTTVWKSPPQAEIDKIIKASLDGGINWFDTAESYGRGVSERALATALCKADMANNDVIIATKWFPFFRTARNIPYTIDERIECLSPCKIDLYQIHLPYAFSSVEAQMDAMATLVEAGKIRYIGMSNFSADKLSRAHAALAKHGLPLASNQVRFNLVRRNLEKNGVLATAKELNISLIAYSPLAQGLLTNRYLQGIPSDSRIRKDGRFLKEVDVSPKKLKIIHQLNQLAKERHQTLAQMAVAWTLRKSAVTSSLIGSSKVSQIEDICGALKNPGFTNEELLLIDQIIGR